MAVGKVYTSFEGPHGELGLSCNNLLNHSRKRKQVTARKRVRDMLIKAAMKFIHPLRIAHVLVFGAFAITPAFANMILISEARSVMASYYGSGIETHSSDGTFGVFEAGAVGTPFGGGFVYAYQKSNITPSDVTIEHRAIDWYGPGGMARSDFALQFSLPEPTRITMSGYCNMFNGYVSLVSQSLGAIPLVWNDGPGSPYTYVYRNYLEFDHVLSPGMYTLSSYELPRESVFTRIALHASSVPDSGTTALMLAFGWLLLSSFASTRRGRSR